MLIGLSLVTSLATVGVALGPAQNATASGACSTVNEAVTVTPDTSLDNLFQNYGNSGTGTSWTGGDGAESVALPDGSELWLFDDSLLGTVTNGTRVYKKTPYIHNAFVIENQGVITTTLYTPRPKPPTAYFNPVPRHKYPYSFWPGGTVVNGGTLQVIGTESKFKSRGRYTPLRDEIASFSLPSLKFIGLLPLPVSPIEWSEGLLSDGGFTYLYGSLGNYTYAARVVGTDLTSPWAYYDGSGWTSDSGAAVPIENVGTVSHFSVTLVGNEYVFISKPSVESNGIVAAFGCSPVGPFGPAQTIYSTPEPGQYPASDGVVTYGAHAHPDLSSSPNTLVISYDVNPKGKRGLDIPDASVYRPRFIDLTLG